MNLLVAAVSRHPAIAVLAVVVAICLVLYALGPAFLDAAQREEPGTWEQP